jgi:uncharacterized protein involved in exopolysaccharide biosynthesis
VEKALQDIREAHGPLVADAWDVVDKIHDPVYQRNLLDALADLDALLPQQDVAARDFAHHPRDAQKKAKLDELNRNIAQDLETISDALADAASAHAHPAHAVAPEVVRLAESEKALAHEVAATAKATPPGFYPLPTFCKLKCIYQII